ncbi:hypothetical protein GT204_07820 [Streptomyces sp. SID4919]|uniref:hypothetical protein n=1 Tax=unclassified Streptomyces TaxID=2593676 RepID=UPI0008238ECB|nr:MULTISPECIES: hypothetical protein [unclassified Streptomyces]MYY08812.1 hypothetical protein [Streptomyces sp. SID4919]SCK25476.1 hypothetical protein YW7DRAFT_01947 [Streptomyces sp. AmelKG-E11A]
MSRPTRRTRPTRAQRRDRDHARTTRRESLHVLLDRASHGVTLTAAEATALRDHVTAEITETDRYRTASAGHQAAAVRAQQRTLAAETAIVEAEQRAETAEKRARDAETALAAADQCLIHATDIHVRWTSKADALLATRRRQADRYRAAWQSARARAAHQTAHSTTLVSQSADLADAMARVLRLAADMRTWASPYGLAADHADHITAAVTGRPGAKPLVRP